MDGPTFWRLAWRLPYYDGAMAAIARELHEQQENGGGNAPVQARGPASGPKPVEGTAEQFLTHPAYAAGGQFGPMFEVTRIPADAD